MPPDPLVLHAYAHSKNSGMTFIPKKVWFHFLHWAYQKRYDFHTRNGMIFILLLVWSSYCFWYDLHTAYGMIFIPLLVWSLYWLWYDLRTTFGMIFILHLVWYLYCIWYDLYTIYGMNIWYNCHTWKNKYCMHIKKHKMKTQVNDS